MNLLRATGRAVLISMCVIFAVEAISSAWWSPEGGLDTPEQLAAAMAQIPLVNQALVVAGWGLGPWAGARWSVSRAPGQERAVALCVGALFTAASIAQVTSLPHPLWMTVAAYGTSLIGALIGGWQATRR